MDRTFVYNVVRSMLHQPDPFTLKFKREGYVTRFWILEKYFKITTTSINITLNQNKITFNETLIVAGYGLVMFGLI
jgi:hypothetical protein